MFYFCSVPYCIYFKLNRGEYTGPRDIFGDKMEHQNISNCLKYHFNRLLNIRGLNDVKPTAKRTVETSIRVRPDLLRRRQSS
jgi:hypothetical protein